MDYEACLKETGLEEDLPMIDTYVSMFGYEDHIPMRTYLRHWYEGKSEYLLGMFKNRLIISEPVSYGEPERDIIARIRDKITDSHSWHADVVDPIDRICECVLFQGHSYRDFNYTTAPERLEWQSQHYEERLFYQALMNPMQYAHYLADNRMEDEAVLQPGETNWLQKQTAIHYDTKPFRFLKQFVKMAQPICIEKNPSKFHNDFFNALYAAIEKFRILHSQCLNRKTLKGRLCLSIHPMDYITMSDNGYGWSSCMRWRDDHGTGEYRTGTVEMMTSPMVVVAYLAGDEPWSPTNQEDVFWTNKKWRQLFIVHRNIISSIKGYPYPCEALEEIVLSRLAKMCEEYGWPAYDRTVRRTQSSSASLSYSDSALVFDANIMYNDTEGNDFAYLESPSPDDEEWAFYGNAFHINYSGAAYCFKCDSMLGSDPDYEDCSSLVCCRCDNRARCAECGCIVNEDYSYYLNGEWYCEECVKYCDVCEDVYAPVSSDEGEYISFIFKSQRGWYERTIQVCPHCMRQYGDETVVINTGDYPKLPGVRFGIDSPMRVALPTIDQNCKDACTDRFDIDLNDLVDFSVKQTA